MTGWSLWRNKDNKMFSELIKERASARYVTDKWIDYGYWNLPRSFWFIWINFWIAWDTDICAVEIMPREIFLSVFDLDVEAIVKSFFLKIMFYFLRILSNNFTKWLSIPKCYNRYNTKSWDNFYNIATIIIMSFVNFGFFR